MPALYLKPRMPQARARRTRFFRQIVSWLVAGEYHPPGRTPKADDPAFIEARELLCLEMA